MPERGGAFSRGEPVFATSIPRLDTDRRVVGVYPERDLLMSGLSDGREGASEQTGRWSGSGSERGSWCCSESVRSSGGRRPQPSSWSSTPFCCRRRRRRRVGTSMRASLARASAPGGSAPALAAIVAFSCVAVVAGADDSMPCAGSSPTACRHGTSEVTIDGVIDEQAWVDALILELRYEVSPGENIRPPVRTVVFLTYDDSHVLVAFRAFDPEPEKIRARYRDRDQIRGDDTVGITLDTFNDERRAYEFWVNPLGVADWMRILNDVRGRGRTEDFDRCVGRHLGVRRAADRFRLRGRDGDPLQPDPVPVGTDGPRPGASTSPAAGRGPTGSRIGLFPRERGANSYLAQDGQDHRTWTARLAGATSSWCRRSPGFAPEERPDFPDSTDLEERQGPRSRGDGALGHTPNITLTGAVNPDFSQIEADAVQLAINQRFALFFRGEATVLPRELGLLRDRARPALHADDRRPVGGPQAHRQARPPHHSESFPPATRSPTWSCPASRARSRETSSRPTPRPSARYRYDLGADSTIGAMVTDRDGEDGYFNRVFSLDSTASADRIGLDDDRRRVVEHPVLAGNAAGNRSPGG